MGLTFDVHTQNIAVWKAFACQWCSTTSIIEAHVSMTSSSVAITKGSSVGYAEPRMNWCYVRSMDCMMHNVTIDPALSCLNIKVHSSNILRYKMRKARKSLRNECFSHVMDTWMHMTSKQHSNEGQASVSGTAGSYALSMPFLLGGSWPSRAWPTTSVPTDRIWQEKRSTRQRNKTPYSSESIQTSERGEESRHASKELDTWWYMRCFGMPHAVTLPHPPRSGERHAGTHRLNACMSGRPRLWKEHSLATIGLTLFISTRTWKKTNTVFHIKVLVYASERDPDEKHRKKKDSVCIAKGGKIYHPWF